MTSPFRCFFSQASQLRVGQSYPLPDPEAHHLLHVLRAKIGSEIHLLDGNGHIAITHLESHGPQAHVRIEEHLHIPPTPLKITLAQGLLKKNAMEWLFREATAIGVNQIIPIVAERSELKIPQSQVLQKMERWREITIGACKQSYQAFLPKISSPQNLEKYLTQSLSDVLLVGSLEEDAQALWHKLETIASQQKISSMTLFIGPEGDFTPKEYQLLDTRRAHNVRLSHQILRSETASSYALSVIDQWTQYYAIKSHR
ncbi:MAG: 16S rRNA (uracil(1498)-N(3))-methyltransferase [Puniceicoccales bacterium]|jgi:16S rRNA (uracil1498-N3)-methyltransferase|nr:16S rRNA (uracil(1498)-N(3))-methyltransferase [Puniceicoccales bacterium]